MNLLIFVLYIFSVMYFLLKVVLFSAWLAKTILCCLCCCGCRCCRKKATKVLDGRSPCKEPAEAKAKNGKAPKATAAEKGKAATAASNNKPAAKAKK